MERNYSQTVISFTTTEELCLYPTSTFWPLKIKYHFSFKNITIFIEMMMLNDDNCLNKNAWTDELVLEKTRAKDHTKAKDEVARLVFIVGLCG